MGNSTNKALSDEELEQLKTSTNFSGAEIADWYKRFHEDFPNGIIRKNDFIKLYTKLFPGGDAKNFACLVFKSYDKDGNGEIDFKEFMATVSVSSRGSPKEKLQWAYSLYDMDNDGTVTLMEVTEMMGAILRLKGNYEEGRAEASALKVFKHLDKNKDQTLSQEEFVNGASKSQAIMAILQGVF